MTSTVTRKIRFTLTEEEYKTLEKARDIISDMDDRATKIDSFAFSDAFNELDYIIDNIDIVDGLIVYEVEE